MTCVVVFTSETIVAKIEDDDVNSVLTKVVGIILVETAVVAKGIERGEAGGAGLTWFLCAFLVPKTVARITMMTPRKMMRSIEYLLFRPCFGL